MLIRSSILNVTFFGKMPILKWLAVFVSLFQCFSGSNAATHWIVTEKGMIQPHGGSPLDLRRPYDLIALLEQEKRWNEYQHVLEDLLIRKATIDEKCSNLEFHTDTSKLTNCVENIMMLSMDMYTIATNGSERVHVNLPLEKSEVTDYQSPECAQFSKIGTSLPEYENFPSLHIDEVIELKPENAVEKLMPVASVPLFGHEIHRELAKNSTSWVHYNLGALFWRIKGNGAKALDCSRRALYYVSELYRDIPLHNLAGILYRAGRPKEATSVLQKAIAYAPQQSQLYLALGNIYMFLKEYNNSAVNFDKFLQLEPDYPHAGSIKNASRCLSKLKSDLEHFEENVLGYLQGILAELHQFHSLQQHWLRLNKVMMWEHSTYDEELTDFEVLESVMGKQTQRCIKKDATISCEVDNPIADFDTLNMENLFQYVDTATRKMQDAAKRIQIANRLSDFDVGKLAPFHPTFPTSMSTSRKKYFDATEWPSEEECKDSNLALSEEDDLVLPIFLPPENKGFDIHTILTDSIDLPNGSEHKLPWYPPICDETASVGETFVQKSEKHLLNSEIKSNAFLRKHFLKYVNNGKADEAEIGQRIITALEKRIAPSWVLSSLASLYWRLRGNAKKALDCLDLALKSAPKDQSDVILVSIASIVHQLGLSTQALKYAGIAFKLNYVEPSTNFLLAILQYDSNPSLAMYYMKNVLRVDQDYYEGHAQILLKTWGCRIKLGTYNNAKKAEAKLPTEVCSEKETIKGQGMVCSANGDDCKSASIQCFHSKNLEDDELEPDQSQLERIGDGSPFHMRIRVGEEDGTSPGSTPEFYVGFSDDSSSRIMLHVYDKSGTYPLSSQACKDIKNADWVHFSSMWQTLASRNLDIGPLLKPLPKNSKKRLLKPYCTDGPLSSTYVVFNHLTTQILRNKLPNAPDKSLAEWLSVMSGDQKASTDEIGAQIGLALQENNTSWLLAGAAALYWRYLGNAEEAIVCLRLALNHVPDDMKDVPLNSLANVLLRVGLNGDALEVAYTAWKINPNFVVNHFTIANILAAIGELEEAISFHRSALALDSNFEPARNRLQAVLCTLLFDESGLLRSIPDY